MDSALVSKICDNEVDDITIDEGREEVLTRGCSNAMDNKADDT